MFMDFRCLYASMYADVVCVSSLSFIPILLNTKYLYETTLKYSGIETDEAPRSVRLNAPMFAEGGRPP